MLVYILFQCWQYRVQICIFGKQIELARQLHVFINIILRRTGKRGVFIITSTLLTSIIKIRYYFFSMSKLVIGSWKYKRQYQSVQLHLTHLVLIQDLSGEVDPD